MKKWPRPQWLFHEKEEEKNVRLQMSVSGEIKGKTRRVHPRSDQGMPRGDGTSLRGGKGKEERVEEMRDASVVIPAVAQRTKGMMT
ncbi:MAG: hypothetical protein V2A78_04920 [bacterium]